jgi:hypothetical protein
LPFILSNALRLNSGLYIHHRRSIGSFIAVTPLAGGKGLGREEVDPLSAENETLKGKIAELERLLGQRMGELDLFRRSLVQCRGVTPEQKQQFWRKIYTTI